MAKRASFAIIRAVEAALRRSSTGRGDIILAAVSGGADSVSMLHALCTLRGTRGFRLAVAHLNHCLRGAESDRDEEFVRALCERLGIDLFVERADQLRGGGGNLEERAREIRYAFLNRVADRVRAALIAVAHQADDQAETVLMHLFRGASLGGLSAMAECGPGRLFRPLLGLRRSVLLDYLHEICAPWVEDSTNTESFSLRNRIRHDLLPALERDYAPGLTFKLEAVATDMSAWNEFAERTAQDELARRLRGGALGIKDFAELPAVLVNAILRHFLRQRLGNLRGLGRAHLDAIRQLCCGSNPSGRIKLPGGVEFRREYGFVIVGRDIKSVRQPFAIPLALSGETLTSCGFHITAEVRPLHEPPSNGLRLTDPMSAIFDIDALTLPLWLRTFNAGDRIRPLGMTGTRKLQDVFVDRKLPRAARSRWPIVASIDEPIWAPGMLRSRVATVTASTRKVLLLTAHRENEPIA